MRTTPATSTGDDGKTITAWISHKHCGCRAAHSFTRSDSGHVCYACDGARPVRMCSVPCPVLSEAIVKAILTAFGL